VLDLRGPDLIGVGVAGPSGLGVGGGSGIGERKSAPNGILRTR
jgi:hypothetical protein